MKFLNLNELMIGGSPSAVLEPVAAGELTVHDVQGEVSFESVDQQSIDSNDAAKEPKQNGTGTVCSFYEGRYE